MTIDLNQTHIDPNNPQYQNMLEDLQGNILKSHERDYSTHILIKFKSDPDAVKKWVGYFTEKFVMSAKKQWDDHAKF